ncbi:Hypothetical predicted protein, partial [Marmota monax]
VQKGPPVVSAGWFSAESQRFVCEKQANGSLNSADPGLVCVLRGPYCLPQIHVSSALPSDPEQTAFRQFRTPYARAAEE